jgi:hypothetical protein
MSIQLNQKSSTQFCLEPNITQYSTQFLPSGLFNIAIENGPVEIVDLPIDSMVDLSHQFFVNVYQAGAKCWLNQKYPLVI